MRVTTKLWFIEFLIQIKQSKYLANNIHNFLGCIQFRQEGEVCTKPDDFTLQILCDVGLDCILATKKYNEKLIYGTCVFAPGIQLKSKYQKIFYVFHSDKPKRHKTIDFFQVLLVLTKTTFNLAGWGKIFSNQKSEVKFFWGKFW